MRSTHESTRSSGVRAVGTAPGARESRSHTPEHSTARHGEPPLAPEGDAAGDASAAAGSSDASRVGGVVLATSGRRRFRVGRVAVAALLVAGWAGALGFGLAWAGQRNLAARTDAVKQVSSDFVMALTNFTPSTVDADFSRVIGFSTGTFSGQAHRFFDSQIRQQLETALASSRGQVRHLFVQSLQGNDATVYAVVDQTYVNSKTRTPQADTLRLVLGLTDMPVGWRVSTVSVLQAATASSALP
ncbi:MAG: hypothetical protein ACYCTL_05540 [Acidimicrobiales bacterium]